MSFYPFLVSSGQDWQKSVKPLSKPRGKVQFCQKVSFLDPVFHENQWFSVSQTPIQSKGKSAILSKSVKISKNTKNSDFPLFHTFRDPSETVKLTLFTKPTGWEAGIWPKWPKWPKSPKIPKMDQFLDTFSTNFHEFRHIYPFWTLFSKSLGETWTFKNGENQSF